MKSKLLQRSLSLVMALALALSLVPGFAPKAAAADGEYLTISQLQENSAFSEENLASDEEVEFLVELEEEPLAQTMSLDDYKSQSKVQIKAIENQQKVLAAAIEESDTEMEITHRYQVVLNGFAVKAPLSAKTELEDMDGVRRVEISQRYDVPVNQAAEGEITSGTMIDSDRANDEGYTGKGTVTAILDTGLDINHQAFANDPAEPVYTADEIAALSGLKAQASGADLYKSAKIPFAYDYADKDADVSDSVSHGTHVAGTVGANADGFRGVAPDTQLCIMKVFSDTNPGASDSDILAALEDCVLLDVDAINMSLGTACGFTSGGKIADEVYNRVRAAGINLMVAAGNDESAVVHNLIGTDLALIRDPDNSIVGSPSTYPAALSVASVNEMLAQENGFMLGDQKILYFDSNEQTAMAFVKLEGEYEYVRVPGVGNANDFTKVDVKGKIALVERGEIPFTEKEQNAKDAGAVGMIVYNNEAGSMFGMQLNGLLPTVAVTKESGKLLKDAEVKTVKISEEYCGRLPNPVGGQMSSFSSVGVSPDLSMKPEITAPGGNVYSTLPGGVYGEMSGTSMACPHMAGAAAVVRQYVDTTFADKTEQEKQFIVNALLMSTADPVLDPYGVPYTPRKQGAGLAQIHSAIHSGAYVTVDGSDRTKAELGDNAEGTYQFTMNVVNFSDTEKSYTMSAMPLVAQVTTVNGYDCMSDYCRRLTADEFTATFSQDKVTVPAGGSVSVTVDLALTEAGKQALAVFPNGIYVEGFVTLTADGENEDLNVPYLGFFGDWGKAPVFDASQYDASQTPVMAGTTLAMVNPMGQGNYLGVNPIDGTYHGDRISYASIASSQQYMVVTPMLGLLRAPDSIRFYVTPENEPDNVVYDVTYNQVMKSFFYAAGGFIVTTSLDWFDSWQPEKNDTWLPDGMYTYHMDATVAGTDSVQSMELPIFIDNEAPAVVSSRYYVENDLPYLEVKVKDNHFTMMAQLVDQKGEKALTEAVAVEQNAAGDEATLVFPLKDIQANDIRLCRVVMADYAWNQGMSDVISTTSQDVEAVEVNMNTSSITAVTTSSNLEIDAFIDPSNAKDQTLTWSSTNEDVAKVVSVSEDTHSATIDFVGVGTCEIRATASNGVYGSTEVIVSEDSKQWPSDNVIREDGLYYVPDLPANTGVTITDNAFDVTLVGDSSKTYNNVSFNSTNEGLHLTIRDLNDTTGDFGGKSIIAFTGASNVLTVEGTNNFKADHYASNAMIKVNESTELTVNGSGTLNLSAVADFYGAGIGGDAGKGAGKIVIESGSYNVNTPGGGAGIGAGSNAAAADITINGGTFDLQMPLLADAYPSNQSTTGAAIGAGYYATKGTTKITINDGTFTGKTAVDSALIGVGFKCTNAAVININGGKFDLTSEGEALHGGACIGTGLPSGGSYATVDITVNGGEVVATSNSDAAAIGGGAGHKTGSVYINGGTVTAVSTKAGDAIGHGSFGDDGNIRISGGTVKAVASGEGAAFGDTSLTNDDSDNVFLVNVTAPGVTQVVVDGKDWNISANHPEDDQLYLYMTTGTHTVTVTDEAGEHTFEYVIDENGNVTPVVKYSVTCNVTNLTAECPDAVKGGETLTVTLTAAEGYALPETVSVTMGGSDAAHTYENGVVTVENVQGDVVVTAEGLRLTDKGTLEEKLAEVEKLVEDNYTASSWSALMDAVADAQKVLDNADATQDDVNAAVKALDAAMKALVLRGNKEALSEAYNRVSLDMSRMNEKVFNKALWSAAEQALEAAKIVLDNPDATEADIEHALNVLNQAHKALQDYNVNDRYKDVDQKLWYNDAIDFVTRYGMMNGVADDLFAPDSNLTRAQMITILYRLEGSPAVSGKLAFSDVDADAYYADAVLWATENDITEGIGGGRFAPHYSLSRQEMVTFIMRYVEYLGEDVSMRESLDGFADADKVSAFAKDAMQWALAVELVEGVDANHLAPLDASTRAQMAQLISRTCCNLLWN